MVAVVSKFVDEMEFGLRRDESGYDAMKFTLDVYPELMEYEYDNISISCVLVQRTSHKIFPLLAPTLLGYGFGFDKEYVAGEYNLGSTNNIDHVKIPGGQLATFLRIKTSQGQCPCSCGGWVSDPDSMSDASYSMLEEFGLIQPLCTCNWASEEWKEFRLMECELYFLLRFEFSYEDRYHDLTAEEQLGHMGGFEFC